MARINNKGQLVGMVGPVIFHGNNASPYVRSKPASVRQTPASQLAAADFKTASSFGKTMRNALFPILQDFNDSGMYRRLLAAIYNASVSGSTVEKGHRDLFTGTPASLEQFQFNCNSPMSKWNSITPSLTLNAAKEITISIPAFRPSAVLADPGKASGCDICFFVAAFSPTDGSLAYREMFDLPAGISHVEVPATDFTTAALPKGHLVLITSAVFYFRNSSLSTPLTLNSKSLHPCEIISAFVV